MERQLYMVETTLSSLPDAERIASTLVEERLTVCARVADGSRSWYHWQGNLEETAEVVVYLKVRADRLAHCRQRLRELHPYDTPMILAWPVTWTDPGYLAWAYGETGA